MFFLFSGVVGGAGRILKRRLSRTDAQLMVCRSSGRQAGRQEKNRRDPRERDAVSAGSGWQLWSRWLIDGWMKSPRF